MDPTVQYFPVQFIQAVYSTVDGEKDVHDGVFMYELEQMFSQVKMP